MGCVASKVDKEEEMVTRRCKERKRLMKQLVGYREEFAAAQVWYLRSLRNTGATLRQFADLDDHHHHHHMGSPPPALPPSPPPPPPFAPDDDDDDDVALEVVAAEEEDCIELAGEGDDACTPPPPPVRGSSWDFWDPFGPPPPPPPPPDQDEDHRGRGRGVEEEEEEEYWADTKTEFGEEEEDQTRKLAGIVVEREVMVAMDDCSSMVSKDTDTAMVVWRSKKTLAGIMKELDHYFLEASSGVRGVAILLENNGVSQLYHRVVRDYSWSKSFSFSFSFTVLSLSPIGNIDVFGLLQKA